MPYMNMNTRVRLQRGTGRTQAVHYISRHFGMGQFTLSRRWRHWLPAQQPTQPLTLAHSPHQADSAEPVMETSVQCLVASKIETVMQWCQQVFKHLVCALDLRGISCVATTMITAWAFVKANCSHAWTHMLPHAMQFASITASKPSVMDEFNRWALYKMQKFFSQSIISKIAAVGAVAVPLVLFFGYLYRKASGKSMGQSMFQVYSVLQDTPGATACDEENKQSALVLNVVWIVGLFSYALVLGIVSDDVAQTAEGFKQGNTDIVESGHTVVLNVNSTTEDMLRQWAWAQKERGQKSPMVLLADKPKEVLNGIVDTIRSETRMDVMAREGVPYNVDDLRLVSANKAKTIIIMDPHHGSHSQESHAPVPPVAATLVSLAALGDTDARVVLQLPHKAHTAYPHRQDTLKSAMNLHNGMATQPRVVEVDALQSLRDAKTQCAVSPGVAGFYQDIFNQSTDSVEVYCKQFKKLDQMTFRDARYRFKDATLLGYSRNGVVHANPPDDTILRKGDWMFGIADNEATFSMGKPVVPQAHTWLLPRTAPDARAQNIIVAAFQPPSVDTLRCLGDSMPPKGSLTIICPENVKMPAGSFRKRFIKGHPGTTALLQEAGLGSADSVLLAGMHDWEDTEADIQVLCSVAQLSDLVATCARRRPLHVVAEARGPLLGEFADRLQALQKRQSVSEDWQLLTTDVLPTEQLVAGVVAQCGMQPELSTVLKELFDVEDAAVTVRHPLKYMQYGETVALGELQERARQHGEIVLGVVDSSTNGVVMTNKQAAVRHRDIKSLIVLSGSMLTVEKRRDTQQAVKCKVGCHKSLLE
eukprot:jgi/Ulvmu1/5626/UM023_0165.1